MIRTNRASLTILAVCAVLGLLYVGRAFWIPVCVAALTAMVVAPIHHAIVRRGWPRWLGLSAAMGSLLLAFALLAGMVGRQASTFIERWPEIRQSVERRIDSLENDYAGYLPPVAAQPDPQSLGSSEAPPPNQGRASGGTAVASSQSPGAPGDETTTKGRSPGTSDGAESTAQRLLASLGSGLWSSVSTALSVTAQTLGGLFLVFVFALLFLTQEVRLREFVLRVASSESRSDLEATMDKISDVAQQYLRSRILLIGILFAFYGLGYYVSGVEYALFLSLLAAVLSIVPYAGNLVGGGLAALVALVTGGTTPLIGVLVTMSLGQVLENYVLLPLVVGEEVSLNPLTTIASVVVFSLVWGAVGAVVAIPLVAMLRVVCLHVPELNDIAFLLGDEAIDRERDDGRSTRSEAAR